MYANQTAWGFPGLPPPNFPKISAQPFMPHLSHRCFALAHYHLIHQRKKPLLDLYVFDGFSGFRWF